jgi:hypothetical protein
MKLELKSLELTAKVEEAKFHLESTQRASAQAHIGNGDTKGTSLEVQAARINLEALEGALEGIQQLIADEREEALRARQVREQNARVKKSDKYRKTIQKADEFLSLFVQELDNADKILADLSAKGSVDLRIAIKGAASPIALATAAKLGETSPQFIENLARALQVYKQASMQCRGRSMTDMALDPSSL